MMATALAVFHATCASAASAPRPHVLYVLVDDWGWADAGWHRPAGNTSGVSTPRMDELVRGGVELTRHYVYKMCSPTRCALQSGRNPIHASVVNTKETYRNPADPVSGWSALPVNMTGLGEVMRRGGYDTHFYGKWDVGMATPLHTPLGRGYRRSLFYFHHQNDYWTMATQPNESDAGDTTCPGFPADRGPRDLWEDDGPARVAANPASCSQVRQDGCVYEDQVFADRVYAAIRGHDAAAGPLFVFWAPHGVHEPLEVPQDWVDRFAAWGPPAGRWERQRYLALVAWVDAAVGNATDLLRARGMWDDTLMICHSDNGGPIYQFGAAGGNNWPLRGGKVSNWEGGVRVNAFVAGGALPPRARGTRADGLVAGWDWYATLAGIAGVDAEDRRAAAAGLPPVDSVDAWPMVCGDAAGARGELALGTDGDTIGIGKSFRARVGGLIRGQYKLLVQLLLPMAGWTGPVYPNLTRWDADYDLAVCGVTPGTGCLFDVVADPEERHNIAAQQPALWREMFSRAGEIGRTAFSPDRGQQDPAACDAVARYGGVWGPWAMLDAWGEARARGGAA